MAHGGEGPDGDGEGVADLCAEFVDETAGGEEADAVGELEALNDVLVVVVEDGLVEVVGVGVPAHEGKGVEEGLDEREDRAVHVVDGGGEKEEKADEPAEVGVAGGGGGGVLDGGGGGEGHA